MSDTKVAIILKYQNNLYLRGRTRSARTHIHIYEYQQHNTIVDIHKKMIFIKKGIKTIKKTSSYQQKVVFSTIIRSLFWVRQ